MDLFPAIDLRGGTAVRLSQGDFGREVRYGDPLELARQFIEAGATWLHVVDLEAARTGRLHESAVLESIIEETRSHGVQVQTGGGIRSESTAETALKTGVSRVVMGTAALEDPDLATRCARRWPGQVVVGLDYAPDADGIPQAMGHGWTEGSGRALTDLLSGWEGEPLAAVVATAIARDGMLEGPDMDGMRALLGVTAIPLMASGGVGSLDHIRALATLEVDNRRLAGVIVGKALVEGRFGVKEALDACVPSA